MREPPGSRLRRLALLAIAISATALAAQPPRPIVREIVVKGFPGDPGIIKDLLRTREGSPLDRAVLDEDLTRLFRRGYLAAYRLETIPTGVRVVIEVTEALRVRKVEIKGTGRSWAREIKKDLLMRPGAPIPQAELKLPEDRRYRADKERVRTFCQRKGYKAVTVISQTARVPQTRQVDITFRVDLGPKYQVKWLRFQGNHAIPDRELRRRMVTKRDTLFTSRRYYEPFFEDDIAALQDYYRYKGFPDARVTYKRVFRGRRGNKVDITIIVEEGRQYPTASVSIVGNKALTTDYLLEVCKLRRGEAYSDEKLIASRQAIERLYQERGYPYVAVRPSRQLNAAGDAFDVRFEIQEGQRITIDTIRTRGHPRTRRKVILHEMELLPGMVYDVRKLERSKRALDRLQFFESVLIKLVPTEPPEDAQRDLLVEVTEARTGMFRFGLGFSTTEALIGAIELVQRNFDWRDKPKSWSDLLSGNAFVGAGQYLRIGLYPGTLYSSFIITYRNPYWKDLNQSFGWSVYYWTRDQGEWDEQRAGIRLTRGIRKYKGDPDTDLTFHIRLESVSVTNVNDPEAPSDAIDDEGSHFVLGAGATVTRDRTDRPVFPTRGYKWDMGAEIVVPYGLKLGAGGTRFWTLGRRPEGHERVFSLKGRIDYALGSFPIFERYYAGGASFRGFDYRGVSPHDNDEPEGGKYRVLLSAEYRYPIYARTLYGVFFADTGTVTDNFTLFSEPRLSIGAGIRLLIPRLSTVPVSIDLGFPVLKQHDDETEVLFFSLSLGR